MNQGSNYHKVQEGDTLIGLARHYYNGKADQWPRIYNANRGSIRGPYERLVPGLKLRIPMG